MIGIKKNMGLRLGNKSHQASSMIGQKHYPRSMTSANSSSSDSRNGINNTYDSTSIHEPIKGTVKIMNPKKNALERK